MAKSMSSPFVAIGLFSSIVSVATAISSLTVNTTVGTVTGFINGTNPGVAQFYSIPFAEPPVGDLRWEPAVAKSPVNGTIDATAFSPSCPQYESAGKSVYNVDAREFLISGPTSEDCLTLNIWAPYDAALNCGNGSSSGSEGSNTEGESLPVLVWIYGGGFQTGGGQITYQIPSNWIQRTQRHIVVGINYRVNIFGFPNAAAVPLANQNLGLLDQRLALEWVRSNIANFGGDTSRITIWGQSAGAESVDYYNFAYPDDPIIAGLILDSGNALLPAGNPTPSTQSFSIVASHFSCNGTDEAQLSCLKKVPQADIEAFLKSYGDARTSPGLSFNQVVDNRTKFANYTARALAGNFTKKPGIIGTNADEGRSLITFNPDSVNISAANQNTLNTFLCPADVTTTNRYAVGVPTHRYLYGGNFSNIAPRAWEGAYHSAELPLIFGTSGIARGASTPFELAVSRQMQDYYLDFISDPVNGLSQAGWPVYQPGGQALEFAYNGTVVRNISADVLFAPCDGVVGKPGAVPPDA
ncbi:MAG: hypothetical protein M1820_002216 [Bogoriella megaspora]|nr:MAG: hypothetical protein M1820_002216 [Bogoriella megaspora]